ncbi:MAG: Autotransporter, partial [Labilithrix sp.]|nr:Autotransporter [Labilithrix sp.]
PKPTPAQAPRPPPPWRLFGGADVGLLGGVGPALAPAGAVFVDVERRAHGLSSTARLSVDVARTASDLRGGSHTYEWVGSTLRVCPAYLALPARFRVAPCAGFQAAGLRGTTRNVRSPASNLQLWLAPVLSGTVEWEASSSFSLEFQAGAVFPLRQSRFFLAPSSTIHEVPALTVAASLGVRVRFL